MARTNQIQVDALSYELVRLVAAHGKMGVSVKYLSQQLGLSPSSISRYIHHIESAIPGILHYSPGQVQIAAGRGWKPPQIDSEAANALSAAASHVVLSLIADRDSLIINAGRTGYLLAVALVESEKTPSIVLTNSQSVFELLYERYPQRVVLTGGKYNGEQGRYEGEVAEKAVANFHANVVVFGFAGLAEHCIYENFDSLLNYQRELLQSNQNSRFILICEWRKIGRKAGHVIADLNLLKQDWHLVVGYDPGKATNEQSDRLNAELKSIDKARVTIIEPEGVTPSIEATGISEPAEMVPP